MSETRRGTTGPAPGWPLWWRWTLATSTGELLGFAVPAVVGPLAVHALAGLPVTPRALATLALLAAAGVVEGAALASAQWLVLRRRLPGMAAREWVLPTALAAGLAYVLGMMPSSLADLGAGMAIVVGVVIVIGPLLLVSIGLAQWLTLRRYLPRAGWWILANALAWPASACPSRAWRWCPMRLQPPPLSWLGW